MTPKEIELRAALHAAHDHLHAGRINEAHEALHCGINSKPSGTGNIDASQAARLGMLIDSFNHRCQELDICAAIVAFLPSATVPGATSIQMGGEIQACKHLERMLNLPPSNYTEREL